MTDKVQINSLKHCIVQLSNSFKLVRFEVLTVMLLRIEVFWDMTLCQASGSQCFKGMQCLSQQGSNSSRRTANKGASVVMCGYSGNGWQVVRMVVNPEKHCEHLNHLNLLYHLRMSPMLVRVLEFLRVRLEDMMVSFTHSTETITSYSRTPKFSPPNPAAWTSSSARHWRWRPIPNHEQGEWPDLG
jgi:hypothetical protein